MAEERNKNSLLYWYPKIQGLPIRQPETCWHPVDCFKVLDEPEYRESVVRQLQQIGERFNYPLFMRTDLASAKHYYDSTCHVRSAYDLGGNLFRLADSNLASDLIFDHIVLREHIPLAAKFKAFEGLPIAPERRYFVRDGEVLCKHMYWPAEALKFYDPPYPDNLNIEDRKGYINRKRKEVSDIAFQLLETMNRETDEEVALLTSYAEMVGQVLSGAWSVDFAKARNGDWILIDMAEAKRSWHPETCPFCQELAAS